MVQANRAATGAPTIDGAVQLDETLPVDEDGIADADGMTNARSRAGFDYQWIRNNGTTDTDNEGATNHYYDLFAAAVGKTLKVEVSFTDDIGNPEAAASGVLATLSGQRNSASAGAPTFGGTAQLGQELRQTRLESPTQTVWTT